MEWLPHQDPRGLEAEYGLDISPPAILDLTRRASDAI